MLAIKKTKKNKKTEKKNDKNAKSFTGQKVGREKSRKREPPPKIIKTTGKCFLDASFVSPISHRRNYKLVIQTATDTFKFPFRKGKSLLMFSSKNYTKENKPMNALIFRRK